MKIWTLTHSTIFSFAIFTFGLQAAYAQIIPDSTVGTIVAPSGISSDIYLKLGAETSSKSISILDMLRKHNLK